MKNKIKHYLDESKNKIKKYERPILFFGITVLLLVLFIQSGFFSSDYKLQKNSLSESREIEEIKAENDIKVQAKLYKNLIERIGPEKAQDDLFRSGLPFTGQTHLLNHTIGDYLYEKYGPKGLIYCKDYFLSSCHHGFILNAIGDGGMSKVTETFDECLKYGPSVFTQCAHGMGHGFLANVGYKNLIKALKTCDEAEKNTVGFPVFNCYDGVFMENIWAVHDGKPSKDRWVKENDPVYPCNDPRIDSKYILACWSNQPALDFQLFKGDLKKVANVCNNIKEEDYKHMCFDGLSRQIHPLTKGNAKTTFGLCNSMPSLEWFDYCLEVNSGASYAVGDRDVPFEICGKIGDSGKEKCYSRLFGNMQGYLKPNESFKNLCSKISDEDWRKKCQDLD